MRRWLQAVSAVALVSSALAAAAQDATASSGELRQDAAASNAGQGGE